MWDEPVVVVGEFYKLQLFQSEISIQFVATCDYAIKLSFLYWYWPGEGV